MTHMSNVAALKGTTPRQSAIVDFLREFTAENGFPPSVRDIAAGLEIRSISTVHDELRRLERLGVITRSGRRSRAITVLAPELAA